MLIRTSAPSRVIVRAIHGYADSMQMKTPALYPLEPNDINVYSLPGVNSPTRPDIKDAPGNHCGSGTYSPNGIRRILSYCEIRRPSSFTSSAELYEPSFGAGSSELKSSDVWFCLVKSATNS